eukprot:TRINITY_DN6261_c0_g1_i1.p1 TRINITY_DN6261_c0_g1~~TRINITY_DN6261_c0_g1_i1.p1  ORF type:complete len:304 (-),score=80.51 TRINITY_DN6261_c0_g1_i1:88-999(-)
MGLFGSIRNVFGGKDKTKKVYVVSREAVDKAVEEEKEEEERLRNAAAAEGASDQIEGLSGAALNEPLPKAQPRGGRLWGQKADVAPANVEVSMPNAVEEPNQEAAKLTQEKDLFDDDFGEDEERPWETKPIMQVTAFPKKVGQGYAERAAERQKWLDEINAQSGGSDEVDTGAGVGVELDATALPAAPQPQPTVVAVGMKPREVFQPAADRGTLEAPEEKSIFLPMKAKPWRQGANSAAAVESDLDQRGLPSLGAAVPLRDPKECFAEELRRWNSRMKGADESSWDSHHTRVTWSFGAPQRAR